MDLYLDRISLPVTNLGPGRRIGLWVQGCSRKCPGCISPELAERNEKFRCPVEGVAARIYSVHKGFDGITISGGEPFDQAKALHRLCSMLIDRTPLDILVYTGYTLEEIRKGDPDKKGFLNCIDFLIDGPYIKELPNTKIWRGSDNQRIHCLSDRAATFNYLDDMVYKGKRVLQYELNKREGLRIVGIPERGFKDKFNKIADQYGIKISRE